MRPSAIATLVLSGSPPLWLRAFPAAALAAALALEALVESVDGVLVGLVVARLAAAALLRIDDRVRRDRGLASQEEDVLRSSPHVADEALERLWVVVGPPHELLPDLVGQDLHEIVLQFLLRDLAADVDPVPHDGLELHEAGAEVLQVLDLRRVLGETPTVAHVDLLASHDGLNHQSPAVEAIQLYCVLEAALRGVVEAAVQEAPDRVAHASHVQLRHPLARVGLLDDLVEHVFVVADLLSVSQDGQDLGELRAEVASSSLHPFLAIFEPVVSIR